MPSEDRSNDALRSLAGPLSAFRSALAGAIEDVRSYLAAHSPTTSGNPEAHGADLGAFAAGRIDPARFDALLSREPAADAATLGCVERAFTVLRGLSAEGASPYRLEVPDGGSLRHTVGSALSRIGRAFGAARVVDRARRGQYDEARDSGLLAGLEFSRWNSAERRTAPPLVVGVDGADLHVATLTEFLDGHMKIVLVVRGDCAPAPLVRMITPGTFVLQTRDGTGLDRLAAANGPGIAVWTGDTAASFVHDPTRGDSVGERLDVSDVTDAAATKQLGGISAAQQTEELHQLCALAVATNGGAHSTGDETDPAGKLAAWLLGQAGLAEATT